MLLNLHVKNLALIDEVDVDFSNHLNILTGETGAGKSIILGSIHIALGGKWGRDLVREGSDTAMAELLFEVEDSEVLGDLEELGISAEEGQILISRRFNKGRTVSKINGENVTANVLKKVSQRLLDVHGQHEHQSLTDKAKHLEILDRFSGQEVTDCKAKLEDIFRKYTSKKKELSGAALDEKQRTKEIAFLQFEIEEIENARLTAGEDQRLAAEYKKMSNSRQIIQSLNGAYEVTGQGSQSMGDSMGRLIRTISGLEEYDAGLKQFTRQLESIDGILSDFNRDVSSYLSDLNYEESDYKETEDRLNLLHTLKSKYGSSIEEILVYKQDAAEKLKTLLNHDEHVQKMQSECEALEKKLRALSDKLSKLRQKNAQILTKSITGALKDLNFMQVVFQMKFETLPQYTATGTDSPEFYISTNPGEKPKPIGQIASGGELSRIMLAVKSVLADTDAIDTLIFDEIDVGVSGRTAQKVSEKLASISKNHQVICITHLPQITAMADEHYLIEKNNKKGKASTVIQKLNDEESVEELARLLGGVQITEAVLKNAKEMKMLAKNSSVENEK